MKLRNKVSGIVHDTRTVHTTLTIPTAWNKATYDYYMRTFERCGSITKGIDLGYEVVGNRTLVTCKRCLKLRESTNGSQKV